MSVKPGYAHVDVKDIEKVQPHAGRLDLLLYDAEINTRYEVELQLGETDETHIIRTIEYWDLERRRYPQYDHVGVIIAEEITARFFNVIGLFNGFIPLIAIQLNAIEVTEVMTLVFTKVLDRTTLAVEEVEGPDEPRDRAYWEAKASPASLKLADQVLGIIHEVEPRAALKYNKNYIGLARDGVASNFITFKPKRQHLVAEFKIPMTDELTQRLQDEGIDLLAYARWGAYRMRLGETDLERRADLLRNLTSLAHERYGP